MEYPRDLSDTGVNESFDAGFGFVECFEFGFPVIVRFCERRVIEFVNTNIA